MHYLHTMVRIHDIDASLDFYCNKLGLVEIRRYESESGRYTNIFLSAENDNLDKSQKPLLELTYNWPDQNGELENYNSGRNFGHLAYAVENIYDSCARLVALGVTINRPPRDGNMAFINSPDNIAIELLQIGEPLPPQEPWLSMPNSGTW
jgi:lactoylglutathione lyase